MSRIHEALKRAQQERATLAATEVIGSKPGSLSNPIPEHRSGDLIVRPPFPGASVSTAVPSDQLEIENLRAHCQKFNWSSSTPGENTFSNPKIGPHAAEQFRTLRSRLYQIRDTRPLQRVMVTSGLAAEGKTFVTYNLAQAFARQPDRRVLLIDADLRRSQMHLLLGAPSGPGLSDYLAGNADELKIIQGGQMPNSRTENLFFIPGGKPIANPSELLMNGRLKTLFDRLSPVFDWIIVDSAPCLPVADANVVAQFCDGVLLVVLGASTPAPTAQRAVQELQGRNLLGVVLNAVENGSSYGSSYYGRTTEAEQAKSEVQ
jgi:protein-tyrosine kinase